MDTRFNDDAGFDDDMVEAYYEAYVRAVDIDDETAAFAYNSYLVIVDAVDAI